MINYVEKMLAKHGIDSAVKRQKHSYTTPLLSAVPSFIRKNIEKRLQILQKEVPELEKFEDKFVAYPFPLGVEFGRIKTIVFYEEFGGWHFVNYADACVLVTNSERGN